MKRWLPAICRIGLGALFIWAAATKLVDLSEFGTEIANYQVLPARLVPWFAAMLPGVEIVAGSFLLLGFRTRAAALVLTASLLVFIVALSQALVRGINLQCGCFGGADLATWGTVGRDLALLIPAILVLMAGPGAYALESEKRPRFL